MIKASNDENLAALVGRIGNKAQRTVVTHWFIETGTYEITLQVLLIFFRFD